MTSLNPSLRLALINKAKSKKNLLQKGFTLVELLVTVVILGTLSAVAVPNFLQYAKEGAIEASNAEAVAAAKKCMADAAKTGASCAGPFEGKTGSDHLASEASATVTDDGIELTKAEAK